MKKIFYLLLLITSFLLTSCSNKQVSNNTIWKNIDKTMVVENANIQNQTKDKTQLVKESNNGQVKNNEEGKIDSNKWELIEIKQEYVEKLKNLESMWEDEMSKLQILANANCTGVCNLDVKNQLTEVELKVAQACYKSCIKKQEEAKQELEKLQKQLEQEKAKYPKKCFQDAEENYKKQQEMFKQAKNLPKDYKLPSKEEFIQSEANRCLLMYGYLNYDCEKIKDYPQPYQHCKRLMQLQQDLQFINQWKYKSFDDYLRERKF